MALYDNAVSTMRGLQWQSATYRDEDSCEALTAAVSGITRLSCSSQAVWIPTPVISLVSVFIHPFVHVCYRDALAEIVSNEVLKNR